MPLVYVRCLLLAASLGVFGMAHADALRDVELTYLRLAVSPDLLDFAHLEIPALENLKRGSDSSGPYLGLRTYHGQPKKNDGVRAELTVDNPHVEGETLRYSWRFMIANDFQSDSPNNRWWLFGDWHDQPDPRRNETWDGFPSRSPPIGLGYGQIDGQDFLSLTYGSPKPESVGLIPFKRGVWNKIAVQITWSRGASGKAAVYINDSAIPVRQANGPNMHNAYRHYLKLGTYRHPDIRGDVWVHIADVKIQKIAQ